jgi:membrane-bound lytic murein transglycosylase D
VIAVSEVADKARQGQTVSPAPPEPETQRIRYRVRRGDTLIRIARRHGVTVRQLRDWNNIRGSYIRIGQRLTIIKTRSNRG